MSKMTLMLTQALIQWAPDILSRGYSVEIDHTPLSGIEVKVYLCISSMTY
jgi:hypothetical protein